METKMIWGIVFVSVYYLIGILLTWRRVKKETNISPRSPYDPTFSDPVFLRITMFVLVPFLAIFAPIVAILGWCDENTPLEKLKHNSFIGIIVGRAVVCIVGLSFLQLTLFLFDFRLIDWQRMLAVYFTVVCVGCFESWRKHKKRKIATTS